MAEQSVIMFQLEKIWQKSSVGVVVYYAPFELAINDYHVDRTVLRERMAVALEKKGYTLRTISWSTFSITYLKLPAVKDHQQWSIDNFGSPNGA